MNELNDWTSGYVTDIGYTFGYYSELNPLALKLAFLNSGIIPPEVGYACELGFGQGLSTNIHAAGSLVHWHGNDFNPAQTAHAHELAAASGAKVDLVDDSFAEFVNRSDLPEFDYIGLHGIWSWISDENRGHLVEFIRKKLKVGGVVYISYNTLPGWSAFAPVRYLMTEHAELVGAEGQGILGRIDESLLFTEKLLAASPAYALANPQVSERIKSLKQQSRQYLAHEYFNRDWQPMSFSSVKDWLAPTKLSYACSANLLDHVDEINLSQEQIALLQSVNDPQLRETTKDFMVNQQFRRDYWVKGGRRLLPQQQLTRLRQFACVLVVPPDSISMKFQASQGEVSMTESIYLPIIQRLSNHQPITLGELHQQLASQAISFTQMFQAVVVLAGRGCLAAVQNEETVAKVKESSQRLNNYLLNGACNGSEISYLVSPLIGGGISASRIEQLLISAYINGEQTPEAMAKKAWFYLKELGQSLIKDGEAIDEEDENLAEMQRYAELFVATRLPIFQALLIV